MRNDELKRVLNSSFRVHHSTLLRMPEAISEYVPQVMPDEASVWRGRAAWAAWAATLACAAGLVALIVLAPLLRARGAALASQLIYQLFRPACHQLPERSFQIG